MQLGWNYMGWRRVHVGLRCQDSQWLQLEAEIEKGTKELPTYQIQTLIGNIMEYIMHHFFYPKHLTLNPKPPNSPHTPFCEFFGQPFGEIHCWKLQIATMALQFESYRGPCAGCNVIINDAINKGLLSGMMQDRVACMNLHSSASLPCNLILGYMIAGTYIILNFAMAHFGEKINVRKHTSQNNSVIFVKIKWVSAVINSCVLIWMTLSQ